MVPGKYGLERERGRVVFIKGPDCIIFGTLHPFVVKTSLAMREALGRSCTTGGEEGFVLGCALIWSRSAPRDPDRLREGGKIIAWAFAEQPALYFSSRYVIYLNPRIFEDDKAAWAVVPPAGAAMPWRPPALPAAGQFVVMFSSRQWSWPRHRRRQWRFSAWQTRQRRLAAPGICGI